VVKTVGGEPFLYDTSLSFEPQGFNVLLGATGSGKTTLIKLLAGLEKPTRGSIHYGDRDMTGVKPQRRNVSLVHQFFINYPNMTVYENIASPLRVARMSEAEVDRRVRETAELMKLTPMLQRNPSALSGGQQQRTALARAVVKESDLVLLDEPLANLDYKLREEMRDELPKLFAGRGATVVYATSEPGEALLLGGRTATMHEGRVTQFGKTEKLYREPADLTTARVFSDPPINAAQVHKQGAEIVLDDTIRWPAEGAIAQAADGDYYVGVRPHFVSPRRENNVTVELNGKVLVTELSGSESVAHFDLNGRPWVSQSHGVHSFKVGQSQAFYLDISGCLYFHPDGARVGA